MRSKSIVLSALLLFLAAAYIYFYEMPASQKALQAKKPFAGLDFGKLKKLEILNAKNERKPVLFINQKAGETQSSFDVSSWKFQSAEYSSLDSDSFGSIVNQLMSYDMGSALPPEDLDSDLSVYGLNNPELELSATVISDKSSESVLKFTFGKRSDFVGKRYVALNHQNGSRDIFMTDDLLFFAANKSLPDLRKKDPVEISDSRQKQIKIRSAKFKGELEIKKVKSNVPGEVSDMWQISSPYLASADDQRVTDMLRAIKNLKVTGYLEQERFNQMKSVLDNPLVEIIMGDGSETTQKIRLARQSSEDKKSFLFWSKYPETIFEFEDDKLFSYFDEQDSYRKTAFFKIDTSLLKSVEVEKQNSESLVKAVKDQAKWTLNNNPEQQADSVFIEEYVQDLGSVSAAEFPASEEMTGDWKQGFGLLNPAYKVTVNLRSLDSSQETRRTLVVGKEIDYEDQSKAYFAAVDDLSEPFIIDKSALDKIIPNVSAWIVVPTPEVGTKVPEDQEK